jgi:ABC-type Fe3+/spermidine/putrescine transport system ATPase subunit
VGEVTIEGLSKSYGALRVLDRIDLAIRDGEFFTLLGPSGCGKTTLLRTIAGFLAQDAGTIAFDGRRIDDAPAHKRDIGMVFQDYAVFPHLSVADNIAFGLRARRLPADEIARRVEEAVRTVRLDGLESRMPAALSGGQQQRVGIARAMAIQPRLLLMDEPLSNLDAKLRIEMREDIRDIQRRLGITTIYVTHDQEEALAISDRICVMHGGRIEQTGTPFEIYRQPARRFAAGFVGTMNFLKGEICADGALDLAGRRWRVGARVAAGPIELAIRPEHVSLHADQATTAAGVTLVGTVRKTTFLGREAHYTIDTDAGAITALLVDPTSELLTVTDRALTIVLPFDRIVAFDAQGDALDAEISP